MEAQRCGETDAPSNGFKSTPGFNAFTFTPQTKDFPAHQTQDSFILSATLLRKKNPTTSLDLQKLHKEAEITSLPAKAV